MRHAVTSLESNVVTPRPAAGPSPAAGARTRLLLQGPIAPTLLRLAAPNLVVNVVLITVTTSVDAHFAGRLGPATLAGLALVFPLLMLMQQMANFSMGGALTAAVARAIGAGRHEEASALVLHGLLIASVIAALFASVFLLVGPSLYAFMGGSGAILAAAIEYSNAIFAGAFAYWLLSTLTSAVRATGQLALLAWVYVGVEILHIGLVPLLVFGWGPVPSLGISGAGGATIVSFTASSAVLAAYLASGKAAVRLTLRGVRLRASLFGDILRTGVLTRAIRIAWIAAGLAAAASGLTGLVAMAWPQVWIFLFTDAPEISDTAATFLAVAALGYAFIGMNTLTQAFQAMGQTFWPLFANASRAAVIALGGWIVLNVTGGGVIGLAIVTASGLAITGIIVATAFWLKMRRKLEAS